jgi:hypothetical protein
MQISAHQLTTSTTCSRPGCVNDALSEPGDDGLCHACRAAAQAPKPKPPLPALRDPLGLELPELDLEAWTELVRRVGVVGRAVNFWIGDLLDQAHFPPREKFAIASRELDREVHHLKQTQWIARAVPRERRRRELSWAHHRDVAALEPDEQVRWLGHAVAEQLTAAQLRTELVAAGLRASPPEADLDPDSQAPATPMPVITARPRLTATVTDPDRIDRWQAAAQARGWTITRLVEEAVEQYLATG